MEKIFTFSCVLCLAVISLPVIGSSFPKRIPFVFFRRFLFVFRLPSRAQTDTMRVSSASWTSSWFFQHEGGRAATEYWRRSWRIFFLLAGGKWIAMCAPMATYWKGTVQLKVRVHPFSVHHCVDGGAWWHSSKFSKPLERRPCEGQGLNAATTEEEHYMSPAHTQTHRGSEKERET